MAFITFGSLNPTPLGNCQALHIAANVVARATAQTKQQHLNEYSTRVLNQRANMEASAWEGLQVRLKSKLLASQNAITYRDRKTKICRLRKFTPEETASYMQRKAKREMLVGIDSVVSTIQFFGVVPPSQMAEEQKEQRKKLHTTPTRKMSRKPKDVCLNGKQFADFVGQLKSILINKQMHFEVGNHNINKGRFTRLECTTYCQLETQHHKRRLVGRDIKVDHHNLRWIKYLSTPICENWWLNPYQVAPTVIRHGMSGFVLDAQTVRQGTIGSQDGCIIVRGAYHGKILDARKNIWSNRRNEIDHYTDQQKFWKGFTEAYIKNKRPVDHTCSSDFEASHVGAAVATVWQAIAPSGKITCKTCAQQLADMTRDELVDVVRENFMSTSVTLGTEFGDLAYPIKFFEQYVALISSCNDNYKDFAEVQKLIGERTEAPFTHINRVNEVLIKGNLASKSELSEATKAVLELARYQSNRTESIQKGSLKFFRNKISGKAKVNMKLMCDNQLDTNGNLKWGIREYHAKRFFKDFLRQIDPSRGYDEFEIRRFPNGSRKLAINNLIISTNFDSIRKQLEEESVGEMPLTNECTSKYNNQFKYPCCCVTHDDGEPLLSSTVPPIKNHLAVGNTGDAKFVDLPQSEDMQMYIARDGYCYINIFLAMYVNVNEGDAKEFTKTLRDRLIPNLGTWPTMMDVATACYYLTLFYPDTLSAELPQILVDHHTKTLHVLDSYGSKSTGYHILKADTVGQLIWFARLNLDSAMKHYRVGGFGCSCGIEFDCDDISDEINIPLYEIPDRRKMVTQLFVRDNVQNVTTAQIHSIKEWNDDMTDLLEQLGFESTKFDHCIMQIMEKQRFTQYEFALEVGVPFDNEEVVVVTHGSIIFSTLCANGITDIRVSAGQCITLPSLFHVTHKYSIRSLEASQVCRFRSKKVLRDINKQALRDLNHEIDQAEVKHTAHSLLYRLIKSLYRPRELHALLTEDPRIIVLAMMSPSVIIALYNSGSFEWALSNVLQHDTSLITLYASLHALAKKVTLAKTLKIQQGILARHAAGIHSQLTFPDMMDEKSNIISTFVLVLIEKNSTDKNLEEAGFGNLCEEGMELMEKNFQKVVSDAWRDLSWLEKLSAMRFTVKWSGNITDWLTKAKKGGFTDRCTTFAKEQLEEASQTSRSTCSNVKRLFIDGCKKQRDRMVSGTWNIVMRIIPHSLKIINICLLMQVLIALTSTLNRMLREHRECKVRELESKQQAQFNYLLRIFDMLEYKLGYKPTFDEYIEHLQQINPELVKVVKEYTSDEPIQLQGKSRSEANLEKVVAFTALVIMLFDSERSDGVYKILNKLKGIVRTMEEKVELQGLDDITDILTEKNLTIDFDLSGSEIYESPALDTTFQAWWDSQITYGRTVSHYNTTGKFREFTRNTAQSVANDIAHSAEREFLIQGAVGSGKSTGLPHYLSSKGAVLIIEPTRPLAENVCRQLQSAPFHVQPSLKMRGATIFGSSPITIMTSGYALHYLANNPERLKEYQFVIFDECHVDDSNAMAFRCLLHEYDSNAKILKVSATPPGRETAFSTQFPVDVRSEESMTFQQFVQQQGTGSAADVIKTCNNILVYVASYNEVDTLAKLLNEKNYKVTKVDGRTMKVGNVEIETCGTPEKKHFIVATNIIENGVTLDIDAVVDFGIKVIPQLDVDNRMMRYSKKQISFGERIQRLGRVGRHRKGLALKIGHTEKGLQGVPQTIATEAAFMCFAYGLPVMTGNVNTSLLSKCTVRQARTMLKFELSIFFTNSFVRYDGSMHAGIHSALKQYKLRESEIVLNKMAIPYGNSQSWLTARQYNLTGQRNDLPENTKIAFYTKDVPDALHEKLWKIVCDHKADAGFGRCISSNVSKIAYTLKTDHASVQRTVKIIDGLLNEERRKEAYFKDVTSNTMSFASFSLASITQSIKARYATSSTLENISTLTAAKDRLLAFHHSEMSQPGELWADEERLVNQIKENGVLENILLQGSNEVATNLKLKGKWKKSLITRDILLMAGVAVGGAWMVYEQFKTSWNENIELQGKQKRQRQKLKFRREHDAKHNFEVTASEPTLEEYYGAAYTKKGKKSGQTHGMGKKNKKFVNMYERDEDDFSLIRFVDPVTGKTIDESMYYSMKDVQERFGAYRSKLVAEDELDTGGLSKGIEAYLIKDFSSQALKADLTAHKPLRVSNVTNNIMGYPEREYELRQTGAYIVVDPSRIPKQNDIDGDEDFELEGKGLVDALRDYSPVSDSICWLNNETDGSPYRLFGIGYGCYIITSSHLFMNNNGVLKIQSKHGSFVIPNTTQIEMKPIKDRDMIILRMPKDFPLFPRKLRFRSPKPQEKVCLVGLSFQDRCTRQTITGQSDIVPKGNGFLWKHWITTQKGQCGLPLVSTKDGYILGIHTAASQEFDQNYFTSIPEDFEAQHLHTDDKTGWTKHWRFNIDKSMWGGMNLINCKPNEIFRTKKEVSSLDVEDVDLQGAHRGWLRDQLHDNLMAEARCPSQLVTKHIVKGKCALFEVYLDVDVEAKQFFTPYLGAYNKSALNREAYSKDILKYAKVTEIGRVDADALLEALEHLKCLMINVGFRECEYVTDETAIFNALNMKSAVGALYSGKKKDYFDNFTREQQEEFVKESCKRLFLGKLGVWNGSMKSELRPIEKVKLNKTRTFTAAPVDTLIAGKVCVDDFNNQFYSLNIKAPWAVGMTKFYGGWNDLLMRLPEGWVYCDADGSQFDSSLSPFLINSILNLRLHFMEEWDIGARMLENLYTEIVYTPVLTPDSTIIKKCKGNNSGQPSTVVDNTLMVILSMIYTLEKLGVAYKKQDEIIRYFVTGDDLLIAIHPDYAYLLNDFSHHFSSLGLNYDFSSRTLNKSDLWFMSHRGILREGIYIPKLEEERIVSILEWDRSKEPEHRLEAICASMIEAWGYDELTHEIRRFYAWVLEQEPYKELARTGKAPYLAESALRNLYLGQQPTESELERYAHIFADEFTPTEEDENIELQGNGKDDVSKKSDEVQNAGATNQQQKDKEKEGENGDRQVIPNQKDKDVNVGTTGQSMIPRIKQITPKLRIPKRNGKSVLDLEFLLTYKPAQEALSNTIATDVQFNQWYEGVQSDYDVTDEEMAKLLDGLMVWCIENGTSPNINGVWTMMDGDEQVEYSLKPIIDHAQPTLRQIMARFSDAAEAYIAMRNYSGRYMPRYGRLRNLKNMNLARYAFDFYQVTSDTPDLAREAHHQMKAAALKGANNRMFGLDGKVSMATEHTERHTADDVTSNTHTFQGAGSGW